jgi:hypothetical protein
MSASVTAVVGGAGGRLNSTYSLVHDHECSTSFTSLSLLPSLRPAAQKREQSSSSSSTSSGSSRRQSQAYRALGKSPLLNRRNFAALRGEKLSSGNFGHNGFQQEGVSSVRLSVSGADEWNSAQEEGGKRVAAAEEESPSGDSSSPSPNNGTFLVGEGGSGGETVAEVDPSPAVKAGGPKGMAEAFSISSRTAFGITAAIAFAALVAPLFMSSTAPGLATKTRVLSYATLLFGFYMAWNIGANDVANAMGTSVGSGALTLRQAVLTAAVLEFSGAFLVGSHVSHTMQKGILAVSVFEGNSSLLFTGMVSSLAAAGTWLQVCNTSM